MKTLFRWTRFILLSLIIFSLLLSACGKTTQAQPVAQQPTEPQQVVEKAPTSKPETGPVKGGSIRIGLGTEPLGFDPPNYKATTDLVITRMIFDGLVGFDLQLNIIPKLATEWKQIDGTKWHFTLRKGVKFSDGSDFSAADVKASFERGAKQPRGEAYIGFIKSVDIIDDFTVDINLTNPVGPFLKNMATEVAVVTSASHLTSNTDEKLQLDPIGTGPFKLENFTPGQSTTLVRNESYWGDPPLLDKVVFNVIPDEATRIAALQAGDVDVVEDPPPQEAANIKNNPKLQLITMPAARDVRLGFQVQDKVLKDPKVRKAIALAVDAKSIVDYVVDGLARYADNGWIPPEVFKPNPPISIGYDPEQAKSLLAEAGYKDGLSLELATPSGRYLRDKEMAEAIQQQLGNVGIKVTLKQMEWGAYLDSLARHEGQLFIIGWGISTGDPAIDARQNFYSTSDFNFANYKNPEMDKILDEAESISDQAKRKELYQRMTEMLLVDDIVCKPIYWKLSLFAASSKVHNFEVTPLELIDVTTAWVEH